MPRPESDRQATIADAAITVIAAGGMRGLTHRAVDRTADLPTGSTSYYARTRAALLELTLRRMVQLDERDTRSLGGLDISGFANLSLPEAAALITEYLRALVNEGSVRTIARYECALEVTRRPELRPIYDRVGARLRAPAAELLRSLGSDDPDRHARALVIYCEGVMFDTVVGYHRDTAFDPSVVAADVLDLLRGMLTS